MDLVLASAIRGLISPWTLGSCVYIVIHSFGQCDVVFHHYSASSRIVLGTILMKRYIQIQLNSEYFAVLACN